MEALNNIEKITLLLSTSIVGLINFLVLIERTKNGERKVDSFFQKLSGIKNTFFVLCLIVLMSSCSGSKFLNRKYTSGRFTENVKSLKHNTVYVDSTKRYSSLNNPIELKKSPISLNEISEKEMINKKVESIIKKDSIFITKRKGRDKRIIKRGKFEKTIVIHTKPELLSIDNLPKLEKEYYQNTKALPVRIKRKGADRYITVSEKGDTIECENFKPLHKIKDENLKKLTTQACNKLSYKAMSWSILSFAGLVLSISALCKIRKAKGKYENINLKEARTIAFVSLGISILTTLCFLVITAFVLNYLGSGIGAAATAGR